MKKITKNRIFMATGGLLLAIASVFIPCGLTNNIAVIIISIGKFLISNFFLAGLIYFAFIVIAELLTKNIFQKIKFREK